jgi:hypothetical protein
LAGSIYSQNRLDDAAQLYHQALNTLDSRAFHLGGVQELHRLFDELELRERAMIVCDALAGMRRSELMGLEWCDLNFFEMRINIVRPVVDQVVGNCKTEVSRKPFVMDEHIASAHGMATGKHVHNSHRFGLEFATEEGSAALWLATVMRYLLHPVGRLV